MSTNIFDANQNFFMITSDNLDTIKTKLYGFMVSDNGIIENENFTNQDLSGAGTYVLVDVHSKDITIKRDTNGSYGLFLFKQDDYFALSNSFFMLVEYLHNKFKLDFNQDFANYMLAMDLVSEALEDTWIKQITMLDKDAIVNIEKKHKTLSIDLATPEIATVPIDSAQGISILDKWFTRWTRLLRNLQSKTNNISTDLSGGFDSRMTFCLSLMSGMDLNQIRVNSFTQVKNPCNAEDFEIASKIAETFNFGLNKSAATVSGINFSKQDILDMSLYTKLAFHKQTEWTWVSYKRKNKQYTVAGDGGELLRGYHAGMSANDNLNEYFKLLDLYYPSNVTNIAKKSTKNIADKTVEILSKKYGINAKTSVDISRLLYMDARSPRHFGGLAILTHLANIYRLQPCLDPEILKLKYENDTCPDTGLLVATIFSRYCPKLLDFKFEGGRFIDEKTINYAKQINAKFPVDMQKLLSTEHDKKYNIITVDDTVSDVPNDNEKLSDAKMEEFLLSVYKSNAFCGLIGKYFNDSVYNFAKKFSEQKKGFPLLHIYPLITSGLILRLIEGQQSSFDWLNTFNGCHIAFPLRKFCFANIGIQSNDFDIVSISDKDADIKCPTWFQSPTKGIMIESVAMNIDLQIKSNQDAKIDVYLRSFDDWDKKTGERVPLWLDYTKISCNGDVLFDGIKPVCFKKNFKFSVDAKQGEIITLHFEWLPHRETRNEL